MLKLFLPLNYSVILQLDYHVKFTDYTHDFCFSSQWKENYIQKLRHSVWNSDFSGSDEYCFLQIHKLYPQMFFFLLFQKIVSSHLLHVLQRVYLNHDCRSCGYKTNLTILHGPEEPYQGLLLLFIFYSIF